MTPTVSASSVLLAGRARPAGSNVDGPKHSGGARRIWLRNRSRSRSLASRTRSVERDSRSRRVRESPRHRGPPGTARTVRYRPPALADRAGIPSRESTSRDLRTPASASSHHPAACVGDPRVPEEPESSRSAPLPLSSGRLGRFPRSLRSKWPAALPSQRSPTSSSGMLPAGRRAADGIRDYGLLDRLRFDSSAFRCRSGGLNPPYFY